MAPVRHLGDMTTIELAAIDNALLLVPLGATEQHGPHLPLTTDSTIALAWCERLAAQLESVVVAPVLPFGSSGEHQSFAGTLSIGHDALRCVLIELTRSASNHFAAVVFISGHAGNAGVLNEVVAQMRHEGHTLTALVPIIEGADAHAGEAETSIMLALAADAVRMGQAEPGCTEPLSSILELMIADGVAAVSANGILGDPTNATAQNGERLLTRLGEEASTIRSRLGLPGPT